jgi:hypothetical protein
MVLYMETIANPLHTDENLNELLTRPLLDWSMAERFIVSMHAIGYGTHPDDRGADIVNSETGEATFTPAQAAQYDTRMDEVFALLDDPYAVALAMVNA